MRWEAMPGKLDRRDLWLTFAVFLAAILFQLPIFDRWLALLDEGYLLQIANDLNRGQILYRDVAVDAPFPLAFELLAAWLRLAGTSVFAARVLAVLFFALYAAATYRVSREVLRRSGALAFAGLILCYRLWAFPHWQFYSYSLVSASLALTAAATLAAAIQRRSPVLRIAGGALLGLAICAKQDYGGMISIAFGLLFLLLPWLQGTRPSMVRALGPAMQVTFGALLAVLPTIARYAWHGALPAMIDQTLFFPFAVMNQFDYTRLPDIFPLFAQDPALRQQIGSYIPSLPATLWWKECEDCLFSGIGTGYLYTRTPLIDVTLKLLYWFPLAITALAFAMTGRRVWQEKNATLSRQTCGQLIVVTLALGFLAAFNKPRDWVHLMMIYPPVLLAGAMVLGRALDHAPSFANRGAKAVVTLGMLTISALSIAMIVDMRRAFDHPLGGPRGHIFVDRQNGPLVDEILSWQRENVPPGVPLPAYPTHPSIAFLAERETVGGFHVIWPLQGEERDGKIIADIENRRVEHLVFSISQWGHLGSFEATAPELFNYLVENFEISRTFSNETAGPILLALEHSQLAPSGTARGATITSERFVESSWPFREVQSQPVTLGDDEIVKISIVIPRDKPILATDLGINPSRWFGPPVGPFRFTIEVEENSDRQRVLDQSIDPRHNVEDRKWHPVRVDLTPYAGRRVDLHFRVKVSSLREDPQNLAGWSALRFAAK